MRRDRDYLAARRNLAEAARDFEHILYKIESRVQCATCLAGGLIDAYQESTNRECLECGGSGWHPVTASGYMPGVVQVLRGYQRLETKIGVIEAGDAVVHFAEKYAAQVESATELDFQGIAWDPIEVTRTPFRRAIWLSVPCKRKR